MLLFLLAIFASSLSSAAPREYFPPGDVKGGWRTIAPAHVGLNLAKLDEAFEYTRESTQHGGLLVVRHGWLVYEKYFGRGHRDAMPELASCGKAFTSIAVGIAIREKRSLIPEGLDQKVFTPAYLPAEIFPLSDPRKAEITLGQLLAMSAGIRGSNPGYVNGQKVTLDPPAVDGPIATTDPVALNQPLWTAPGGGYSYATSSPHLASIVLRRITGMEMEKYMRERIGKPLEWGEWGYAMHRPGLKIDHTPGGGSIAMRSTDVLRFAYLLLHGGKWGNKEVIPSVYVEICSKPTRYNPHYPYSLQFEVNDDRHVAGAPRDAYWKSGAGGFSIYVIPSLDMVIYKMGGTEKQYDSALTGLPVLYNYDGSRDQWKLGKNADDSGVRKLLELVSDAVEK